MSCQRFERKPLSAPVFIPTIADQLIEVTRLGEDGLDLSLILGVEGDTGVST
jgi:hypothetical protein